MNLYRQISIILCISLFSIPAFAQITIDSNEYDVTIGSKQTLYYVTDFSGMGIAVDLGTKNGPQTWNFSPELFPGGSTTEYTVIDPATTPYADQFPNADHVWLNADESDTTAVYNFFNKTNTGLFSPGFAMVRGDSDFVMVNDPASQILPFPASLNNKWTNTEIFEFGVPGIFLMVDSSVHNFEIDAWGTINTPQGSYQCLRIFEEIHSFTKTYAGNMLVTSDSTGNYEYYWYAENIGFVAEVMSFFDETDPNFTKAEDITFIVPQSVNVKDNVAPVAQSFQLMQNYPNPFNPTTTIGFNLPKNMSVSLKVYDIRGREITTLLNETKPGGYHEIRFDGSSLASGIYLYELKTANFSEVRKMAFAK